MSTMSSRLYTIFRGIQRTHRRKFSTAIEIKENQINQISSFRTIEDNPVNHNANHLTRYYTIPADIHEQLFRSGGVPRPYITQAKVFNECSLLIRQPAVEIISYLNQTDYTKPVNKYVLYGKFGTGKSLTLTHISHYAFMAKYVLVHVYWACRWFKSYEEVTNSVLSPGYMDLPLDAGMWLRHFKSQNLNLIPQLELKVSKDYVWNQRETTQKDTPILELVEFGINRVKYACGVIDALIKELKLASTAGKCKTMVVIDGFNAFTSNHTRIRNDNRETVLPKQVTLTLPFLDITKSDWCNGAVVLTVDATANKERRDSDLPRYLLGKEGFEHLDPFIPIFVDDYTTAEFDTVMEYYKERKWVRSITAQGQKEIEFVTNKNPFMLMDRCQSL